MRKLFTLSLLALLFNLSNAQQLLLNGSFETNVAAGNVMDMYPPTFPITVSNVYAIDGGYCDLITTSTFCGPPHDGNWYMQNNMSEYYGAFSIKIDSTLNPFATHFLSFWSRPCGGNTTIDIGFSYYDSTMGTVVQTFTTVASNLFTQHTYTFNPPDSARYLTVNINNPGLDRQGQVDKFELTPAVANDKPNLKTKMEVYPNPSNGIIQIKALSESTFHLKNIFGETLRVESLTSGVNTFDFGDLPKGIYILESGSLVSKIIFN